MSFKINKLIIIVVLLFSFVIVTLVLLWLQLTPQRAEEFIIDAYNNNPVLSKDKTYPLEGGFADYISNSTYSIVITSKDIFRPKLTLIKENKTRSNYGRSFEVSTLYLERNGINSWKVIDYRISFIDDINTSQVIEITEKHDLHDDFDKKDKYNITTFTPLTTEEIEKSLENTENRLSNQKRIEEYNNLNSQEKEMLKVKALDLKEKKIECFEEEFNPLDRLYNEINPQSVEQVERLPFDVQEKISAHGEILSGATVECEEVEVDILEYEELSGNQIR